MLKSVVSHWVWIPLVIIAVITAIVVSRPAFRQKPTEVVIRPPGNRLLELPVPAQPYAVDHFPYALISYEVYGRSFNLKEGDNPKCADVMASLGNQWTLWRDFPDKETQFEMEAVHLRAHVWENTVDRRIVVSFGGTDALNWHDWVANTHWLHPFVKDEYTVLEKTFAPAFAKYLANKAEQPEYAYLGTSPLIATGHSLGAGLAQKFAYSLPAKDQRIQRVTKVYAFDTSPVTTFLNTSCNVREENKEGLNLYRIYERGEILAILRSITAVFHKPSKENPAVTQYRYNVFGDDRYGLSNPLENHSIQRLGCGLKDLASEKK